MFDALVKIRTSTCVYIRDASNAVTALGDLPRVPRHFCFSERFRATKNDRFVLTSCRINFDIHNVLKQIGTNAGILSREIDFIMKLWKSRSAIVRIKFDAAKSSRSNRTCN